MSASVQFSCVFPVTSAPQPIGTMQIDCRLLEFFPTSYGYIYKKRT